MGQNWNQRTHQRTSSRGKRFFAGSSKGMASVGTALKIPVIPAKYEPELVKVPERFVLESNLQLYTGVLEWLDRQAARMHTKDPKWWRSIDCYIMEKYADTLRVWLSSVRKRLEELEKK